MSRAAKEVDKIEFEVPLRLGRGKNDRGHWKVAWQQARKEKAVIHIAWPRGKTVKGPWVVTLCRVAPRGKIDDDNLVGSLKAVRDQVAEELGVDDGSSGITFQYAAARGPWSVRVIARQSAFGIDSTTYKFWESGSLVVESSRSKPMSKFLDDMRMKAIGGRG